MPVIVVAPGICAIRSREQGKLFALPGFVPSVDLTTARESAPPSD